MEEYVTSAINVDYLKHNYKYAMIAPLESNGLVCINDKFYAFFKFSWIGRTDEITTVRQEGVCKIRASKTK